MPVRNLLRVSVVLDGKLNRRLDELAKQANKSRSAVIRDALTRVLKPIPDADLSPSGTHHPK